MRTSPSMFFSTRPKANALGWSGARRAIQATAFLSPFLALACFASNAHAESFAFSERGEEATVWLERVAVVHSGNATVTTVALVTEPKATRRLVELPEGSNLSAVVEVASPFAALDDFAQPRYVDLVELDPCASPKATTGHRTPPKTCEGVPGAMEATSGSGPIWDAIFQARKTLAPVSVVTATAVLGSGLKISSRAKEYAKAHPKAIFALSEAEAFSFSGMADTYVWPSATPPEQHGAAWVEVTALDRERREPRLSTFRSARAEGMVQKAVLGAPDQFGSVRLGLAREVLARSTADAFEEVSVPHSCFLDARSAALLGLGLGELPPGRVRIGFDPSSIPEPPYAPFAPNCPPKVVPGSPVFYEIFSCRNSMPRPDPRATVPTVWPSVARWLGHSGKAFEVDFMDAQTPPAAKPVVATYAVRRSWHGPARCPSPKWGRYEPSYTERSPYRERFSEARYAPLEVPFATAYEPSFAFEVFQALRPPKRTDSLLAPVVPIVAPASARRPGTPGPPPVPKASACACDAVGESGGSPLDGSAFVVAVVAFCVAITRARRPALP